MAPGAWSRQARSTARSSAPQPPACKLQRLYARVTPVRPRARTVHHERGLRVMQRLLVVEDETDIADLLNRVFSKEGFEVGVANDGMTALESLRREPPDLVVLDWMLPQLSGIEVLKEMRARAETRMVPVIMLTARREEIDRVLGLELGADDYVTKPFSARELVLRIRGLLKRGG